MERYVNSYVELTLISSASVVDVNEDVEQLEIRYRDENIKETGQALRVVLLKIINNGSVDIVESSYSTVDPVGIRISQARIIQDEVEVFEASSDYLSNHQRPTLKSQTELLFSPVILESGEYFVIKLILLHPQEELPDIRPIGKIAGVKEISFKTSPDKSISSWVTLVLYGLFFGFQLFVLVWITFSYIKSEIRRKREKNIGDKLAEQVESAEDERKGMHETMMKWVDEFKEKVDELKEKEAVLEEMVRDISDKPIVWEEVLEDMREGRIVLKDIRGEQNS